MLNYLKLMLQLVLAPSKGWDDVAAAMPDAHRILLFGLLPLCVLTGASVGVAALWDSHLLLSTVIIRSVITFAVYMLTYFIAQALLTALLPRITEDGLVDRERISVFAALNVGQMALIGFIENLLPAEVPILQFLPLFVVVVMYRARGFLGVDSSRTGLMLAFGIVAVILPVYILGGLLGPMAG
ncbi:MAG: hypothetical protein K2O38_01745 [Muribaculaceae bacterium]|nr:hypothetical protein [Muribaculaceae bacterium]